MGTAAPYYHLPVNVGFVALAIRDERPDSQSYLDLDTGGVFTLLLGEDAEPLAEELDCRLRHNLREHPERFVAIYPLTDLEKKTLIEDFAGGLTDEYLKRRLRKASGAESTLNACEEILRSYPELQRHWYEHLIGFLLNAVREMLRENSIEPQIALDEVDSRLLNLGTRF